MNDASGIDWTPALVSALRNLWSQGLPGREISNALGCTVDAVLGKVNRLGLPPRRVSCSRVETQPIGPYARWTAEQDGWLLHIYETMTPTHAAAEMGRTMDACRTRVKILRQRHSPEVLAAMIANATERPRLPKLDGPVIPIIRAKRKPKSAPMPNASQWQPVFVKPEDVRRIAARMQMQFTGRREDLTPINRRRGDLGLPPVWCRELSL